MESSHCTESTATTVDQTVPVWDFGSLRSTTSSVNSMRGGSSNTLAVETVGADVAVATIATSAAICDARRVDGAATAALGSAVAPMQQPPPPQPVLASPLAHRRQQVYEAVASATAAAASHVEHSCLGSGEAAHRATEAYRLALLQEVFGAMEMAKAGSVGIFATELSRSLLAAQTLDADSDASCSSLPPTMLQRQRPPRNPPMSAQDNSNLAMVDLLERRWRRKHGTS